MADEAEDELLLENEVETEEEETEEQDKPEGDAEDDDEEQSETVIGFGDEAAPASEGESSVIRELRARNREQAKRLAELERGRAPERIEVGDEPTLEGCEYDEDRFKAEWKAWDRRKADAERHETEARERAEKEKEAWTKRLQTFEEGKARLNVAGFDDAEAEVKAGLPDETMAIILHTDKAAELVYALSRSPSKLEELSKLDPLQAALMIGELKGKLQVTKRKLPDPDRPVVGTAAPGGSTDKQLARLEAEAERTGDRSKVIAYKRQQRRA